MDVEEVKQVAMTEAASSPGADTASADSFVGGAGGYIEWALRYKTKVNLLTT